MLNIGIQFFGGRGGGGSGGARGGGRAGGGGASDSVASAREDREFAKSRMDAAEMRGDQKAYDKYAKQFDDATTRIRNLQSQARAFEQEASSLERELAAEMSSTDTRHSVGWRRNTQQRIDDLREKAARILYGG